MEVLLLLETNFQVGTNHNKLQHLLVLQSGNVLKILCLLCNTVCATYHKILLQPA
jgi:hypothetical protein